MIARTGSLRRTTTFRLIARLGAVAIVAAVALFALVWWQTEWVLTGRTDQILTRETRTMAGLPSHALAPRVRTALAFNESGFNYWRLTAPDGTMLAGNLAPVTVPRLDRPFEREGAAPVPPLRLMAQRTADGGVLLVGRDIVQIVDLRRRLLSILVVSGLVTGLAALAAAVLLGVRPLRRTRQLTEVAQAIAAGDLAQRMPVSPRGDELDLIATTVNAMVEEIERLLIQVKGATDAIAHDLRSPLASVRMRLAALEDGSETPLQATVSEAVLALDTVLARFTALLRISELEAAGRRAGFALIDPLSMAGEVCELYEPLAEERGIHLLLAGEYGLVIDGDSRLLFEALGNLVENAIKFIAPGGTVQVSVRADDHAAVIAVEDDGPGIAPSERDAVLRRFHRGAATRHLPGSGLGLSLVSAIAHLHKAAFEMENLSPGLVVRLRLPRHVESAPHT